MVHLQKSQFLWFLAKSTPETTPLSPTLEMGKHETEMPDRFGKQKTETWLPLWETGRPNAKPKRKLRNLKGNRNQKH